MVNHSVARLSVKGLSTLPGKLRPEIIVQTRCILRNFSSFSCYTLRNSADFHRKKKKKKVRSEEHGGVICSQVEEFCVFIKILASGGPVGKFRSREKLPRKDEKFHTFVKSWP